MAQVVWHYRIHLKLKKKDDGSQYLIAPCPLPTHKEGDRALNFTINVAGNWWKCWSDSCNANNGKKGGDCINCINFVAAMERCSQSEAKAKLVEWFGIKKPAPKDSGTREGRNVSIPDHIIENTSPAIAVKYTEKVRQWWNEVWAVLPGEDEEARKLRLLKVITSELLQNYRTGKSGKVL